MSSASMELVIITGLSGAGKSQAVRCLEDLGYYCVDNLPPTLVPGFLEIIAESGQYNRIGLVMDIRGGKFFTGLNDALQYMDEKNIKYQILFLEAFDEVLIRRFKETRRKHPLAEEGERVAEGVVKERKQLEELRGIASKIIDTSEMLPADLKEQMRELFGKLEDTMVITIMSFGFKYGIPLDSDLVLDVRFLPNPYYKAELKNLTGHDQEVQKYIFESSFTKKFLAKIEDLIKFLIPNYYKEGKSHLLIAIGCTGGEHRSVFMASKLFELLKDLTSDYRITIKHRDIDR